MRVITAVLGVCVLVFASTATGQERSLASYDLPRDVERHLASILEDAATRRMTGATRIEADQSITGNVVAYGGLLTVAGKIDGELIVMGGDVEFLAGAAVAGDVTVIGGNAIGADLARIGGTLTTYSEGFQLYHGGERVLSVNTRRRLRDRFENDNNWGRSTITFRTGTNYNRVEGLPILFGPMIETGGTSPTRVEALGIIRTGSGDMFNADRMGYQLRAEQFLGGRAFRIGAMARSVVEPIESWTLTDTEASLATFLLHEDQRDYFNREGWSVYARLQPRDRRLDLTIGYSDEDHDSKPARDPWTLFGDGAWRAQPLVAQGSLRSVSGDLKYDHRNRGDFASSGFYVHASATRGLGGSLAIPQRTPFGTGDLVFPAQPVNTDFNTGLVDLRVYRRVGIGATLALRGVAGGSLDDKEVPPQFQHAIGGAGTLPGYRLFRADCGARSSIVARSGEAGREFFPYYGCDRFAMGSVEYRGGFTFDFGGDFDMWGRRDDNWDWHVDASPNWMLFFDAAQGWALGNSRSIGGTDTGILYDAGAGILLGDFGIYAAVPLNGKSRGVNVFVRLGPRF